ncbi:signal transducer [Coprinopsis cinerea okayama7|uniref:Signal transducer n=1 Tax=Coprinopsis cinerea (strain Okayama-7 / 130 / ATCC MYA-4618 / FGSC 9003) TaxID=240176 RepID=A8N8R6_COPC7|nr:signal transducer [Coprinopsis cinerea okayama7\|eukprot:XP_001831244.2 signal transducer [Coprinopsis cinerea okayama7\
MSAPSSGPSTHRNDLDEELDALYESVLHGYTIPPAPRPPPVRGSSSGSGRAPRPLPPTPGGLVGRPPIPPPAGTPLQRIPSLPVSRPGSSLSRHPPGNHQPEPMHSRSASPNRTPQRPALEIDTVGPVDQETPASVADSTNAQRWSEVPSSPNEYLDPDVLPVPEYIPNIKDDPAATRAVYPEEQDSYHTLYQSNTSVQPSNYDRPYGSEDDQSYYSNPPLSYENEERPPYEPDPSYPDNPYPSQDPQPPEPRPVYHSDALHLDSVYQGYLDPSQSRLTLNDRESEVGTVMSDYSMLRPPPARSSAGSDSSYTGLPYLNDNAGPSTISNAASSSWNGVTVHARRSPQDDEYPVAGPSNISHRVTQDLIAMRNFDPRALLDDSPNHYEEYGDDDNFDDPTMFINLALLSHIAVQLQLKVPRGTHVKGSIPYPRAFTGKDIVTTIHSILENKLTRDHGCAKNDRRVALQVARSLQRQLFFVEVEWGSRILQDGVEDVYSFLDDPETPTLPERAELPSGVVTMLTGCYSVTCGEGGPCYSGSCPSKGMSKFLPKTLETPPDPVKEDWTKGVPPQVLRDLPEYEINRQTIIHKLISKEEQYVKDLDIVDSVFIQPLRKSPVIPLYMVDEFIDEVFGNILEIRDCNRRLLEVMYVRQREQAPIINTIGDIFLDSATQFRKLYPLYIGRQFLSEMRLREELDNNGEFRVFIENCQRQLTGMRSGGEHGLDLWHYLNRPTEHLQKYPVLLQAVYNETARDNPDGDFLLESISAIKNLQNVAQLRTFQSAMGKGTPGKWEWHDLLTPNMRKTFTKEESQRQSLIFEVIKTEMVYVRDLETLENLYRQPLQNADPPIIPHERLEQFCTDVFHNIQEIYVHHKRLVDKLHEIQLEEHPRINSITAALFDAALNFREAYMEYIPNYPIAEYRIDDELEHNPAFKAFVEKASRRPESRKLDLKYFINRPIPRVLRYGLLLKEILSQTPITHEDRSDIPEIVELIGSLARESQPGVDSAKQKVEVWRYNSQLVYRVGEAVDMDLLNEHRSLVHTGKLMITEDSHFVEVFVMLFDNYLVWTKVKEKDGITKYHVVRKPIPLDLLHPVSFNDPPIIRNPSRFRSSSSNGRVDTPDSMRNNVYPFTLHQTGRQGTANTNISFLAESPQVRADWKAKLEEALGLRKAVADANKVFEIETLSNETFLVPPINLGPSAPTTYDGVLFTGRVTCSVPFKTAGNRGLVAVGCAEGVWIGFRQDPRSLRRVLHVRNVVQCAILEDFGLFLVLADKNLFAYHIEALVPNPLNPQPYTSQTPHKINTGSKEVQFFSVGMQHGRTLVIYMNKRGADSVFHVVEPVIDKITERPKAASTSLLPIFPKKNKSDWFRTYRDFILPGESYDMIFLKAKVAVLCAKGFEIVDLTDFKTVTIPQKDNPALGPAAKRCESCRPMGMFRSSEDEFLLCYNEFGIYVDKHGAPSRSSGAIEWEGTAERVALHAPYILIFDTRFIEIRHIDTCRLAQIIPGNDLRCIWDGRGIDISHAAVPADAADETFVQEPRVHAVMSQTSSQPGGRGIRGISQHVFQLVPTIPLYLPGSLTSPSHIAYYPQSNSPPRSPPTRAASFRH